jgi:hypothetical protein
MEGENMILAEFPTIVPIDQRYKFVLDATFDSNQTSETKEQVISIKVVDTDVGKFKKYSMIDLKVKLRYFEPQS